MKMRSKIGYALGDFGISIAYFIVGFFFMYYLTDILHISPLLAGSVVFIGKLWEGASNPIVGVINDRIKSRFGRKRSFIMLGAIPFALSFILLWLIPVTLGEPVKFALAVLTALLYATAYSVVSVPYMALVPVMTGNYDERTQIVSLRAVLSTVGIVLGGGAALIVSSFGDDVIGLRTMAIVFGVIAGLSLLIAARSVSGVEDKEDRGGKIIQASFGDYAALLKEEQTSILLLFKFLGAIATGSLMAAIPYFAKHILSDVGSSTYGVAIYTVTTAALIPLWYKLTTRFDKRRLLLIANSLGAIVLLVTALAVGNGGTMLFFVGCGMLGLVMSAYLVIPYSLIPDLVDFYHHKTGVRHESVYFGVWMTVHQIGIGAAGLLLGLFLSIMGYDGSAEEQTGQALLAVRLAFGLLPGVFLVLAALVLQKYGITRQVYEQIRAELAQNRP